MNLIDIIAKKMLETIEQMENLEQIKKLEQKREVEKFIKENKRVMNSLFFDSIKHKGVQ